MSERRRWIAMTTRVVVFLGLGLVGLGTFWWLLLAQPEPVRRAPEQPPVEVVAFRAEPVEVARQWRGFGTATARDAANVPARVAATVERVPEDVEAGYVVEAGQLLVELDPSDFEQQREAAAQRIAELEAQLDQLEIQHDRLVEREQLEREDVAAAERELERARRLLEREVMTDQEVDRAQRELLAAQRAHLTTRESLEQLPARRRQLNAQRRAQEASLAQAKLNVQRTRIRSPIAGVLERVDVKRGESVAVGQSVARIVSLQRIEVPLRLPSSARATLGAGDPVTLLAADGSEARWTAHVRRIAPSDDAQTRTVTAYVELEQDEAAPALGERAGLLAPGTFVEGFVESQRRESRWVVPRRAIRDGVIRTIDDARIASRRVEVAWVFEGRVEAIDLDGDRQWAVLTEPLPEGQLVMLRGATDVLDGQRVEPTVLEAPERLSREADTNEVP